MKKGKEILPCIHEHICRREQTDFIQNLFVSHANPQRCRAATSRTSMCTESKTRTCFTMINSRTCRAPYGVLPPPALAAKPQDSLTNTEERLMCHGMPAKPSLLSAEPFSAKPELAMGMENSPFLKKALQKWSSQSWTGGNPSLMTYLVSWAYSPKFIYSSYRARDKE